MRANTLTRISLANVPSRVDNVTAAVMILGVYLLFLVVFLAFVSMHS